MKYWLEHQIILLVVFFIVCIFDNITGPSDDRKIIFLQIVFKLPELERNFVNKEITSK